MRPRAPPQRRRREPATMEAYRTTRRKSKLTHHIHTTRAARLAERAGRELTISAELVVSRDEAARLVRLADQLRAFALSLERITARTEASHA
jgi:hypothetical protein